MVLHIRLRQLDRQLRDASWEAREPSSLSALALSDTEILENEFRPEITALDPIGLPNYQIPSEADDLTERCRGFSG